MKYFKTLYLLSMLLIFFVACTASDNDENSSQSVSRLDTILQDGVIRAGTPGDFNPMTYVDEESGEYVGYYIDVVKDMAADMGVEVEWVKTTWRDIVTGITADKYDIATGASFNMGRARSATFTLPIAEVGTVALTRKEYLDRFQSWEDINRPDVKVAVTLGTVFYEQSQLFFPDAKIISVEPPVREYLELVADRAQVSLTSNIEASQLVKTYPEIAIVPIEARNRNANGMIVPRDDQIFLNYVNVWITMKESQSYFQTLADKWGI